MPFPLFRQSALGIAEHIVFGTMPPEMNPASRRPTARLAFLLFHDGRASRLNIGWETIASRNRKI
jgi:hypothetical protein